MFYEFHKKTFGFVCPAYGAPQQAIAWSYEFLYLTIIFGVLWFASGSLYFPLFIQGIFFIPFCLAFSATFLLWAYIDRKSSMIGYAGGSGGVGSILQKKKDHLWFYYFLNYFI